MILYSFQDVAKFLGCAKKTVQRMVERGEMPTPVREEKDAGGKVWRLWESTQLDEVKRKLQTRVKHRPTKVKVSTKRDNTKEIIGSKKSEKYNS